MVPSASRSFSLVVASAAILLAAGAVWSFRDGTGPSIEPRRAAASVSAQPTPGEAKGDLEEAEPAAIRLLSATTTEPGDHVVLPPSLVQPPTPVAPEFEKTGRCFADYGVTVAVVCYAPDDITFDFHDIDEQLAKYVAFRLVNHKIRVVDPVRIEDWLDENDDWDSPAQIGAEFAVDFLVYIDLVKYNLYEQNAQALYRGRSESFVSVYEMDENGDGEQIFTADVISRYPARIPRRTSEVTYQTFKAEYLSDLSDQIGRLFYEHDVEDDAS